MLQVPTHSPVAVAVEARREALEVGVVVVLAVAARQEPTAQQTPAVAVAVLMALAPTSGATVDRD